jgi:thiol-disulfide isomerase/thioredoxin
MKKHFLFTAVAAALMTCACSVEPMDIDDVQSNDEGEITVLTAGFSSPDATKTVRQADGKVFWSPNDAISVVRGSNNKQFKADNTEPAAFASFTGTMPSGAAAFWAVYPYDSNANIQSSYLVTTLPAQQEAVAGSFANNLFISAAYVRNGTTDLTFHHQCGGVKFSVTQPGVKRVTLVPADGSVFLAGLIGLYAEGAGKTPYIRATGSADYMSNTIELNAPAGTTLEVGEAYHFVTMPARLAGGLTLLFEKEDGTVASRTLHKDVTIEAGHFVTLMDADEGVEYGNIFEFSPSEITVDPMGGVFSLTIRSSVDYHVDVASDWIKEIGVEGNPLVGAKVSFSAEKNTGEERTGMLVVCDDKNCYTVTVTQGDGTGLKKIVHHSLGMRFTATWCGYCPIMNETFKLIKSNLGDKFEYVCLYATDGNYGFADGNTLASQYAIGGYPTGIIDGRFELNNYSSEYGAQLAANAIAETELYYPATSAIGLESSVSGQTLSVKAEVMGIAPDTYKLTVILMENGIIGYQADYDNGSQQNFRHDRVARKTLTSSISGDSFSIDEAGATKTFNYSVTVPSEYDMDNLSILAYVQRSFGDRPAIQSGNYGSWYVDNCRVAAVGATAPLEVE